MEQSITVDIAAPPERVWEVLSDVEYWSEWTPTVTSVRRLDEGPLRPGQPREDPAAAHPGDRVRRDGARAGPLVHLGRDGPGVLTTARHDVEPLPGGGTRVRLSVTQSGWLGSLMGRFYRGLTDRYLANEANGLKARCEQQR